MTVDLLAVLTLIAGIYLLYAADEKKKSGAKAMYIFAGLAAGLWGVVVLFGTYPIQIGIMPLAFGFFTIGAFHSKGNMQIVFGAIALLVFLQIIL